MHAPLATKVSRPPFKPKTVGEALYWSYANLAMAYASGRHNEPDYQQIDFIVRNKTYYGLLRGSLRMGSFFMDEKCKIGANACCYCKSGDFLSLDHLIPQFSGRTHSADNLVLACRSCNSSKGKIDFLAWTVKQGRFPPLHTLRRYLKLAVIYCVEHDLMTIELVTVEKVAPTLPMALSHLPYDYPTPLELFGSSNEEKPDA